MMNCIALVVKMLFPPRHMPVLVLKCRDVPNLNEYKFNKKPMKKRLFQISIALMAVVVFFSSCSKIPEQMNAIPSDASMVAVFNTKKLMLKARMDKFNETNIYKKLKKEIESEGPEVSKVFDEIIKNPLKTGIKVTSDICFYVKVDEKGASNMGAVAGISNRDNFTKFVSALVNASKSQVQIKKEGAVNYINEHGSYILWNDKVLLITALTGYVMEENTDGLKKAIEQLNQSKEKSLLSSADFQTFYKNQKDVDFWISNKNLRKLYSANSAMANIFPAYYFGTSSHVHAQFNKGDITVTSQSFLSDSLKNVLKSKPVIQNFSNTKILQLLPDKAFVAFSFSVNMANIYDLFIKNIPNLQQADETLKQNSLSIKEIFTSIGGDFIFTLNTVGSKEVNYPMSLPVEDKATGDWAYKDTVIAKRVPDIGGAICLSMNSTKLLDTLMAKIPQGQLVKEGNIYSVASPALPVFFTIKDNIITVSTQKELVEKVQTGGQKNSLANTDMGKRIMQSGSYFYANINIKSYPDLEKLVFTDKESNQETMLIYKIWSIFDSIEASANAADYSSQGKVKFTSDKENSLYLILKTVDDNLDKML